MGLRNIRNDHISISKEEAFNIFNDEKPLSKLAQLMKERLELNEQEINKIKNLFPELFL